MSKSKYITNKKYDKLVTICIPSRNRPQQLAKCIQSIIDTVDNINDVEIIVRLDNDDFSTWAAMDLLPDVDSVGNPLSLKFIKGSRFGGYVDLWKMDNQIYHASVGEFQFHLNDDAVISTKGWDTILKNYSGQVCILRCGLLVHDHHGNDLVNDGVPENIFPMVHTSICDSMGMFGFNTSTDKMYDMFREWDPELAINENRIQLTHMQEVGEHVKDNLPPTNPSDIYNSHNMEKCKQLFKQIQEGLHNG